MGFDITSFLMGKAAGGGGGGSKTFFTSGWIQKYDPVVVANENVVELKAGSSNHNVYIAPPANVEKDTKYPKGSKFVIAVTITTVDPRVNFRLYNSGSGTITSKTGLFQAQSTSLYYATTGGSDVLTVEFTTSANDSIRFYPTDASGNSSDASNAVITITGISYNGEIIFGTV